MDLSTTAWTAPALASALAVLIGATCWGAVQLARTYVVVINLLEGLHRAGVPVRGAKGAAGGGAGAPLTLGGGGTSARETIPTAAWSQLTDLQMASSAAGAAAQDCAEECVAIACQAIKRVPVPAEYIRWLWFGTFDARLAGPDDLVGMLACVDIKAHPRKVAWTVAQVEITRAFERGELAAILGYWLSTTERHWMLVVAATAAGPTCRDPWTGTLRSLAWSDFQARYSDAYVHIDQTSDLSQIVAA